MSHGDRLDECFKALNEKAIHDYEAQVHRYREQDGRPPRPGPKDDAVTEVLKSTQVDFKKLEAIEEGREEALAAFLRDERPKVVQHPANVEALRQRTRTITELSRDRIVMPPYAATLLSAHASDLEGNPGPSGNPWILPWNPGQIRMKRVTAGSGWALCGWARGAPPGPSLATVWFAFTPDRTAVWNLLSVFGFHGFFQIFANDDWWNCKWATLQLKANMSVFQFFWNPTKTFDIINRTESNIAQSQIFDSSEFFDYNVALRAGELAFVKVDVSMFTDANGGGCSAELNFADFNTNFIEPVVTFAWA